MGQELQTIRGRTEDDVLQQLQDRWGEHVEIVSRRMVCEGIWNKLWGWQQFEVQALPLAAPATGHTADPAAAARHTEGALESLGRRRTGGCPELQAEEIQQQLRNGLKNNRLAETTAAEPDWSGRPQAETAHLEVFRQMVTAGASEGVARELVQQAYDLEDADEQEDPYWIRTAVARQLLAECRLAEDPEPRPRHSAPVPGEGVESDPSRLPPIVALVGPSGSGKTTTLVKLAADLRLRRGLQVALVSADTYRVAAAEQLRCLAELLDTPLDIVQTPRDMARVLRQRRACDTILVDTAGRNPRDQVAMQELKNLLNQARPDHVHLVLSATESGGYLQDCATAFAGIGANRLVLTRVDEASRLGNLIPLVRNDSLAWSYVACGQNLKTDLHVADLRPLLSRILGGHVADVTSDDDLPTVMSLSAWNHRADETAPSDRFL